MHGQVKELVSNYGRLDILWFDFSYDDMCGEKWRASELIEMVRSLQPDVIIDNRLEGSGEKNGSIATRTPLSYSGDFASPEQIVPPDARGTIPQKSADILTEAGKWMDKNAESIYGCGISSFRKPEWGRYTQKGNTVYAHIYETPLGALPLYGISPERIKQIRFLGDGRKPGVQLSAA